MAAEQVRVHPVHVHMGGAQVSAAAETAAEEFVRHLDGLAEAGLGWVGSSREALSEFASVQAARHTGHLLTASQLHQAMMDAAITFAGSEHNAAEQVGQILQEVADAVGGVVGDVRV